MELIKSKERVQKYGEVFTPQWVVEKMCDELPDEAWKPETTFLEPSCGEGVFILEILRRKFENCKTRKDYRTALKSVYGFEIQADNVKITIENVINLCKKYFKISQSDIEKECAYYADFVYYKDGELIVEDVKGMKKGGAYELYKIKRKLMLERYGIRITEIK